MSPKKLDAEDKRMLREWAHTLPVVMEWTTEKHKMNAEEIRDMGYVEEVGGKVEDDGKYLMTMPVQMAANHYRRLKQAWLKEGQPGILKYFKKIAGMIEENKEHA